MMRNQLERQRLKIKLFKSKQKVYKENLFDQGQTIYIVA